MTEYRLNAYHIMWLFVFFDLPVSTKKEMKAAALFRKNLEKTAFHDAVFCLYTALCIKRKFGCACEKSEGIIARNRKG